VSTLRFTETRTLRGTFGLTLVDAFTNEARLATAVGVEVDGVVAPAFSREYESTFVFLGLAPGAHVARVRAPDGFPYYLPKDIPFVLPTTDAHYPLFPDPLLADPSKMLDDSTQTAAYLAQRAAVTLAFTPAYPFPSGTTLVRGTVFQAGPLPLGGATVTRTGGTESFVTGDDGQFVLHLAQASALGETVTLHATAPGKAPADIPVAVRRGLTATATITL
jgi:hypothetical protein